MTSRRRRQRTDCLKPLSTHKLYICDVMVHDTTNALDTGLRRIERDEVRARWLRDTPNPALPIRYTAIMYHTSDISVLKTLLKRWLPDKVPVNSIETFVCNNRQRHYRDVAWCMPNCVRTRLSYGSSNYVITYDRYDYCKIRNSVQQLASQPLPFWMIQSETMTSLIILSSMLC